ncbi:MAG: 3-deoxy-7-phosphoheptulonate synthase [archaeon]
MILVLTPNLDDVRYQAILARIEELGLKAHISKGVERTIIGLIGDERKINIEHIQALDGVEKVMPVLAPYKLVSREAHPDSTIIDIDGVRIGGEQIVVMAGPCSVESREQLMASAEAAKAAGAQILRGGAFKPRTSPYSFQGMEEEGLKLLAEAREKTGLKIITEVIDPIDVDLVTKYADILQIGARSMQNFRLLKKVGKIRKPVLLKRGMSATLIEFLMAAEYIMSEGNHEVMLCERGIRTFVEYSRNTLDLNVVPKIKKLSHLPVIVDPSHGTGDRDLIAPMSNAAVACGADGLIIEIHPKPEVAVSDGKQSLRPEQFTELMRGLRPIVEAVGKTLEDERK